MSKIPVRWTATFIPRILFLQTHSTVQVLSIIIPLAVSFSSKLLQTSWLRHSSHQLGRKCWVTCLPDKLQHFQVLWQGTHSAALHLPPHHQHPCSQLQVKSHSSHAGLSSLRSTLQGLRYRLTSQEKEVQNTAFSKNRPCQSEEQRQPHCTFPQLHQRPSSPAAALN